MDTFRIILPALVSLFFSTILVWIIASFIRSNLDKEARSIVNKIAWIITFFGAFFSIWWLVTLLSVNNVPRSVQDRTLNKEMRNSFEERMIADTTKTKTNK